MMASIHAIVAAPWPWYVSGPLIGLIVPALLVIGNRQFGISSNLRHVCAATLPRNVDFFHYDWRHAGAWNLAFAVGIVAGGAIVALLTAGPASVHLSAQAHADLVALGIRDFSGLAPTQLFSWSSLLSWRGMVMVIGGGFLVGFGTAYAGGCTSGHAIFGLADRQLPSLVAVAGFFAGGLLATWFILPLLIT